MVLQITFNFFSPMGNYDSQRERFEEISRRLLNHFWFFRNPTVREIKSGCEGVNAGQNLIDDIMSIREDEYLAVEPSQIGIEDRFLKDGPIFKIKLPKTKGDFFEKKDNAISDIRTNQKPEDKKILSRIWMESSVR